MNYKKRLVRLKYIISGASLLTIFIGTLIYIMLGENRDTENMTRYMLVGKKNVFLVYEDKLAIEIPFEIQLDKEKTLGDLIEVSNYKEALNDINYIFPEKIKDYKVLKYGEVNLPVKVSTKIPEVVVDDKRYILTSSIEKLFENFYNNGEKGNIENSKVVVDILNANGKAGYARKTGDKLKKELGVKYNAANYETNINESYIIINDLNKKQTEDVIMTVNEKYFKIREDATIPTLANVIIVLGKEDKKIYDIDVVGVTEKAAEYMQTLSKDGYIGLKRVKTKAKDKPSQVSYNKEDYFVAYKIAKKLGIENMKEEKLTKNKIVVSTGE
ncbi:LytR C-terminal domain-containing protein [Fusobacterium sp.]|uniref:LytR C-terminal domain-containing protein n=1 Tax=Fusobacterium sp. TaxID=68766 RepID=UPI00260A1132|nr:LytR C-terminal domain-containing protein [Fusobacterium sp.]